MKGNGNTMPLTDSERAFLDQPGYARMATLMPDGSPQVTVLWYRRVDDELHIVCPESAQKVRNLDRDNRISLVVEDPRRNTVIWSYAAAPRSFEMTRWRGMSLCRSPDAILGTAPSLSSAISQLTLACCSSSAPSA